MCFLDIEDAEWREIPDEAPVHAREPVADVPPAVRARARLAQTVALRDMKASWRGARRTVSAPSPRVWEVSAGGRRPSPLWLASCGGSRTERAHAAEALAVEDFLSRPARPCPPLRSI